jgi:Ca2+-binding RTX toxin-like protein
MNRILVAAAVTVAAAVAVPSMAHGATIHQDGRTPHRILLQDAVGESNLVSVEGSKSVVFHDLNVPIEIAGVPTCMAIDAYTVSCSAVRRIELDLGVGQDFARIDSTLPVQIDGGAGNDRYNAATTRGPSSVNFAGGIGLDTASYGLANAGVNVAVDLEPGDGRSGDDDQILRDVESVFGSQFSDVLVGSHRTTQLLGLDGDDVITGGIAAELLSGGWGNDRIDARDGVADDVDCGGQMFDRAAVDLGAEASVTRCAEIVG